MRFNKQFLPLYIITLLFIISITPVQAEEEVIVDDLKSAIILVPLAGKDVPSYIPMIADKLFDSKLEKIDVYTIFNQEEFSAILNEEEIELPKIITEDIALQIGQRLEMDQVLFGIVSKENDEFIIKTRVMDIETGQVITSGSEKADSIRGIEQAVGKLTRNLLKTVLPEELVAEAVESLDNAEQTAKEEDVQESISEFEKLAEENPEEALNMVAEPVREAIKDTVREDIVEEEIQVLYDKEKADKRRVWQFWTTIGLESFVQLGNYFGSAAIDLRLESLLHWNNYMNNIFIDDPYRSYRDALDNSQNNQIVNYLFTGGANLGLALAYNAMPDDLFSFSGAGRQIFAISNMLQISGYMSQTATAQLGFYAQRKYMEYSTATSDFTAKYEEYRTAYLWPMVAEYSRTGLWTIGLAGMVTAALLPGDKTPMVLTDKSRKYLTWGQTLIGIGNLTTGMANNFRGKAEEYWISDNSPSGTIGDSTYLYNYITSEILYYSTYAIYIGGAVLTYLGLTHDGSGNESNTDSQDSSMENLSFSIIPAQNGITAVARLRLD
ncbi:MAG: hypothetical protein PF693_01895 [Spirochaetia bacterium]|jgi:hypothetical protein|nr:hypothetical protein [Spirochaetia bacterium]